MIGSSSVPQLPSETLTQAFANCTPDYLIVFDESGGLLYSNPAFVRVILGGEPMAGRDFFSLMDSGSAERGREACAKLSEGPQQAEVYHFDKSSCVHQVTYNLCRVESGVGALGREKTPDLELLGRLAQANDRLERLANTDPLTGLHSRNCFFTVVEHLFEEARRYKLPLCCYVIDMDHFKSINDRFGDLFGDHVLKAAAGRLRHATRLSDLLARYGGEEFVLVAPNTDLETGMMLAERLRRAIEQEPFALGNAAAAVTISLGLSGTQLVSEGPFRGLLNSAEQALLAAKNAGCNRCCVHKALGAAGL